MKKDIIDETKNEIVDETKENFCYSSSQEYSQPRMRFCTRCGSLFKDTANFCENCGKYRYDADNRVQPVYPGRATHKKDGRSYGVPALIMMITSYKLYFMSESGRLSFSVLLPISIVLLFFGSIAMSITTLEKSRKGKVPAIITLCLAVLPILIAIFVSVVVMVFAVTHPDYEP